MDKRDLETFLGVLFKKYGYNKLELIQPHLIQRIINTLGLHNESIMHNTPADVTLNYAKNREKRC